MHILKFCIDKWLRGGMGDLRWIRGSSSIAWSIMFDSYKYSVWHTKTKLWILFQPCLGWIYHIRQKFYCSDLNARMAIVQLVHEPVRLYLISPGHDDFWILKMMLAVYTTLSLLFYCLLWEFIDSSVKNYVATYFFSVGALWTFACNTIAKGVNNHAASNIHKYAICFYSGGPTRKKIAYTLLIYTHESKQVESSSYNLLIFSGKLPI